MEMYQKLFQDEKLQNSLLSMCYFPIHKLLHLAGDGGGGGYVKS